MRSSRSSPALWSALAGGAYEMMVARFIGGLMALVCVKNGSLARDRVRRECGLSWDEFDAACASGSADRIAFPFFEREITPPHEESGIVANFDWASASAETKARSIIRGQVDNLYRHTRWIGSFKRIASQARLRLGG